MVLSYSQLANLSLRSDCNTFWDICGAFKVLTKYRPSEPFCITEILQKISEKSWTYLKCNALCRRPLLASRDCNFGGLVPPFCPSGSRFGTSGPPWVAILESREHLGKPFWYLRTTLEDHGSSKMDARLQITGFCRFWSDFRTCLRDFALASKCLTNHETCAWTPNRVF